MYIEHLTQPHYIQTLNTKEKEYLAHEIRLFLKESLHKTGGHYGSNLGIVELTIALHDIFPVDEYKYIYDIGHQTYVHKLLLGEKNRFSSLRQHQGLSGYQKRYENPYDVIEARHPGMALSLAQGYSTTLEPHQKVVVVLGDSSLTHGTTYEAIRRIVEAKQNIIIIFNDNQDSVKDTTGLNQLIDRVRVTKTYLNAKKEVTELLNDNAVGKPFYQGLKKVRDVIKDTVMHSSLFTELGLEYLGPINGHNFNEMDSFFEKARAYEGPILLHVKTKFGQFSKTEATPFYLSTKEYPNNYYSLSKVNDIKLSKLAKENEKIFCVTHSNHKSNPYAHFESEFPQRYLHYNMDYHHGLLFSAGLAMNGKRPFIEMSSLMSQSLFDTLVDVVGRLDLPLVIGLNSSGLNGESGESFHGVFDVGILQNIPNFIIAMGKDANEHESLLYTAFKQYHPFILRYTRYPLPYNGQGTSSLLPIGSWEVLHTPDEVKGIIVSYGPDLLKIEEKIKVNHLPLILINARYIKPMDENCLKTIQKYQLPVLVYETEMLSNNLGTKMLEFYNDNHLSIELQRTGIDNHFAGQGSINQIRKSEQLDLLSVLEAFMKEVNHEA